MLAIIEAITAFITDPEARKKAPISFNNGAAMSVRDAKKYGLYHCGQYVTRDYLEHLSNIARDGGDDDKAVFIALRWNWTHRCLPAVSFFKSELEGKVQIQAIGPAFARGGHAFITLESIGEVLLSRAKPLESVFIPQYLWWLSSDKACVFVDAQKEAFQLSGVIIEPNNDYPSANSNEQGHIS